MKYLILFISVFLFAYQAQVKPFLTYKIRAAVSGEVVFSNKSLEGKNVHNALIVKIDDTVEKNELKNLNNQINILKKEIKNQEIIIKKKKQLYDRYKKLKSKSLEQKDAKFFDYIASKNQLLNLKSQLSSLYSQKAKIEDLLNKKNIKFSGYLYSINVNKGDYVSIGSEIALGYDISKQKLDIYVPINKLDSIKNKIIYINGKRSNFKIYKIYSVTDPEYITSYKVELVGNGLKFGDVVTINFKTK